MKARTKRSIIISSVIAVMFITPLVVFAILFSSAQRKNSFRPAKANIQVKEDSDPQDEKQKEYTLLLDSSSHYSTAKSVQIYDERTRNDEYIRVRFVPMWYDNDGNLCGSLNGITDFRTAKLNAEHDALLFCNGYDEIILTLHLDPYWESSWTYNEAEQCFCYTDLLHTGGTTPALLESVTLSQAVYEDAEGYILHLDVLADAIQQYGDAKTYRNWSE